jgi:uncharacterized membrane protein
MRTATIAGRQTRRTKMKNPIQGALLAAAVATLFAAGGSFAAEESKSAGEEVKCEGINSCKGTGACAGAGHACAGQNACKGHGWTKTTADDCKAKGGKVVDG